MTNQLSTIKSTVIAPAKVSFESDEVFKREAQFAMQLFEKNKFLADVAVRNPSAALGAIKNIGAMGLTLNPSEKLAYLVPRGNEICTDISYRGLLKKAMDSGACRLAQAKIVYEKDCFQLNGCSSEPTHSYNAFNPERGNIVGAYCTFKINDSDWYTETMTIDEINKIKSLSKASNKGFSPWTSFQEEMIKKTVIKRGLKYLPGGASSEMSNIIDFLNTKGGEGIDFEKKNETIIEGETVIDEQSAVDALAESLSYCESKEELDSFLSDIQSMPKEDQEKLREVYKDTLTKIKTGE